MTQLFLGLSKAYRENRLGHGLILSHKPSEEGVFATSLRQWLQEIMCPEPQSSGKACMSCPSCLALGPNALIDQIAHPDFIYLQPAGETGYNVEQIREMSAAFSLTLAMSKTRVVWISEAHKLSASGGAPANALLKLLEEPRPSSLLVLSTSSPEALLPTIRSRCQHFRFRAPDWKAGAASEKHLNALQADLDQRGWNAFLGWIQGGALPGQKWVTPADDESFWKERQLAVEEMQEIREMLWILAKPFWPSWDRHAALRVWDLFFHLELLLNEIKRYAQPQLSWLKFKMDASEAHLWKV